MRLEDPWLYGLGYKHGGLPAEVWKAPLGSFVLGITSIDGAFSMHGQEESQS